MDKLRSLAPWQIILLAFGLLLVVMIGGYFAVKVITAPPQAATVESTVPQNLDSEQNKETVAKLKNFKQPPGLPQPNPIRTVDPNNPGQAPNPFK